MNWKLCKCEPGEPICKAHASAPDLLEALKDVLVLYVSHSGCDEGGIDPNFVEKAKAAIDKAEGR